MKNKFKTFILAAGLGERLRPITDHIPKPLMPVLGKPVIERVIRSMNGLDHAGMGMNLHYKREIIEEWLNKNGYSDDIKTFHEDPILGTGGALRNAADFLSECTFLVHNSDIISDVDLAELVAFHESSGNIATLAVHYHEKFNNLCVDSEGDFKMIGFGYCIPTRGLTRLAFTGIAVYEPEFLEFLPPGDSSVIEAWDKAVSAGRKIGTLDVTGSKWTDIGTPASYARAVFQLMREDGESMYIDPEAGGCKEVAMAGMVALESGSSAKKGASLKNCILLRGGMAEKGENLENCIKIAGHVLKIDEGRLFPVKHRTGMQMIGSGGSDRDYYRMSYGTGTAVLLRNAGKDSGLERHIRLTEYLSGNGVPVPGLLSADTSKNEAIFEDLGDTSLYNWLKCEDEASEIEMMYRSVLDVALKMHFELEGSRVCDEIKEVIFDYGHFRWETDYFIEMFVRGIRGLEMFDRPALENDLDELARTADEFNKTVIHRDLQSQNIMVVSDGSPRLIDYQGARMGPPAYDLASLLWDPYAKLDAKMRSDLLRYYLWKATEVSGGQADVGEIERSLIYCRLQRHMQSLGAYGNLSMNMGKRYFLKFVTEGIDLLKVDMKELNEGLPALRELIGSL
ncbi:MAG: phosphotransferase [Nitrospirota bacterium]|nr:MAG: phosphotransferase [Nitrospirota bacterium]